MHIVHFNLERTWRGGERQVYFLVRELARHQDVQQTVVCRKKSPLADRFHELMEQTAANIDIRPVANRIGAIAALFRLSNISILHAHTGNTIPLAVWPARSGCKSVITRRITRTPKMYWFQNADHVVSISNYVERQLLDLGLPGGRSSVIASAVEQVPSVCGHPESLRERVGITVNDKVLLVIGALTADKQPIFTLELLAQLPDVHLVWVGDGELRPDVNRKITTLGLEQRAHFIGFDHAPNHWFSIADFFLVTGGNEGLGTSILDAFVHQVPVVGLAAAGSAEIMRDGQTAICAASAQIPDVVAALEKAFQDRELCEQLVGQATKFVRQYSITNMADSYLKLYRDLFNQSE